MVAVSLVTTFGVIAPNTCSWARARVVDSRNYCLGTRWTMGPRLRSRSPSPNGCRRWCCVLILELRPSSSTRIDSGRAAWARLSIARSARSSRTNRGMLLYFVPSCAVLVRSTSTRAAAARRRTSCTPTSSTRSLRPSPPASTSTTSTTGSACGRWDAWWPRTARWSCTATSSIPSAIGSFLTSRWRSTVLSTGSPRRSHVA